MNTRLGTVACVTLVLATVVACVSPPTPTPLAPTSMPTSQPATPTERPFGGRVEKGQITSAALAGNLLGDPTTRDYYVYLPQGYDTSTKRYPVVYVLHWGTAMNSPWVMRNSLPSAMDWPIDKGEVRDMILVFPDATNKLGGAWYMSSPTVGDYETYIAKELVAQIDSTYRTLPSRESRGIMGCSMGGVGTFHLAWKYPDVYSVAVPMSGLMYDLEHDPSWEEARSHYGVEPTDLGDLASLDLDNIAMISLAAVAAPNPSKPPFFLDMPFKIVGGSAQIDHEVFRKVIGLDAINDARSYVNQPLRLNGMLIYRDTDQGQNPVYQRFNAELYPRFLEKLTELGIEHEYGQVEASHCKSDLTPALKFMDAHLAF